MCPVFLKIKYNTHITNFVHDTYYNNTGVLHHVIWQFANKICSGECTAH